MLQQYSFVCAPQPLQWAALAAVDVDMSDALQKVRDAVELAKPELPDDARDDLIVREISASDWPIMQVVLSADYSPVVLKRVAEDVQEAIEGVPGVLGADLTGGVEREVEVSVQTVELEPGDRLVLCSDCLTDMLTESEIAAKVSAAPDLDQLAAGDQRLAGGQEARRGGILALVDLVELFGIAGSGLIDERSCVVVEAAGRRIGR